MPNYVNAYGQTIQSSQKPLRKIALTDDIDLNWQSAAQNSTEPLVYWMLVTPNASGHAITLPNSKLAGQGASCVFWNKSAAQTFIIKNYAGTTLLTVAASSIYSFVLDDTSTEAGSWSYANMVGEALVTSIGVAQPATGLNITSSSTNPITSSGTFTFALDDMLAAIETLSVTNDKGIMVQRGTASIALRSIESSNTNILTIQNADGSLNQNIVIQPSSSPTFTQATVGTVIISDNKMQSSTDTPIEFADGLNSTQVQLKSGNASQYKVTFLGSNASTGDYSVTWPAALGTDSAILNISSAGQVGISPLTSVIATKAQMLDETNSANPIVPSNLQYSKRVPWFEVVFDGTVSSPTILDSLNVETVTRNTTGTYTITLTNAFDDQTKVSLYSEASKSSGISSSADFGFANAYMTGNGTLQVFTINLTGTFTNYSRVRVIGFGKPTTA